MEPKAPHLFSFVLRNLSPRPPPDIILTQFEYSLLFHIFLGLPEEWTALRVVSTAGVALNTLPSNKIQRSWALRGSIPDVFWGCLPGSSGGLCCAIVLPGRKSVFRAGFRPDSNSERFKIGPLAGRRPAGRPILRFFRLESGRSPARKAQFPARKQYCVT